MVISLSNHTSPPSIAAAFLATHLVAVIQLSRYSIFYDRDTSIYLVFHGKVIPVSVSTLKPLLRVIEAIPLKPQASPIVETHI